MTLSQNNDPRRRRVFQSGTVRRPASVCPEDNSAWACPISLGDDIGRGASSTSAASTIESPQVIAVNGTTLCAVWVREDEKLSGNDHVRMSLVQSSASFDSGASWSQPQDVSARGFSHAPHIVATTNAIAVVWHHFDGMNYRIHAIVSLDFGVNWSSPQPVSPAQGDAMNARVTRSQSGVLTAVWQRIPNVDVAGFAVVESSTSYDSGAT